MEGPNLAFQYCSLAVLSVNEMLRDNVTDSKHFSDSDVVSEAEWIISCVLGVVGFHSEHPQDSRRRELNPTMRCADVHAWRVCVVDTAFASTVNV